MTRLAVNDIATGYQPLFNEDRTVALLYNGEIYNSDELREKLERNGHVFSTRGDGEVICHLYDQEGLAGIEKLDGMYAAALWDERRGELYLFRDHAGEKPLYYSILNDRELVFSSDVGVLARTGLFKPCLRPQSIWDFFTFLWVPQPETVYENVFALMPGHYLRICESTIEIRDYQAVGFDRNCDATDENALQGTIHATITESVQRRLMSDVPVGAFLSGGLDSSIVTAIAARRRDEMTVFTVALEDVETIDGILTDESEQAAFLARELRLNHEVIQLNAETSRAMLLDFVRFAGQPFAVSSGLGIMAVAKRASDLGIKVLLSGDGADEVFGGYSHYAYLNAATSMPAKESTECIHFRRSRLPLETKLRSLASLTPPERICAWRYYATETDKAAILNRDFFSRCVPSWKRFEGFTSQTESWSAIDFIRQDRRFLLTNEMMVKLDRMTMAHSIEGRSPFAAPRVLALGDRLRYSDCVREGESKWALRRAFSAELHPSIVRRRKHGFSIPVDLWLTQEWAGLLEEACATDSALSKLGLITTQTRNAAFKLRDEKLRLNGHTLFCLIVLNLWLENEFQDPRKAS